MNIPILRDGPYLHAIGWLRGKDCAARVATTPEWSGLPNPIDFAGDGGYRLQSGLQDRLQGGLQDGQQDEAPDDARYEIPAAVMRGSGVTRARSAAKATVYSALLARKLLDTAAARPGYHGDRAGVAIASGSSITPIAWKFETAGLRHGWDRTDTLLLPSSIPSAITTQVSAALDTHAAAIAFQDGLLGVCAALEYAHLSFLHRRSDCFLVMGADEVSRVQCDALAALDDRRPWLDGASGMVLGRGPNTDEDWQLTLCANVSADRPPALPADWSLAASLDIEVPGNATLFTAPLLAYALHALLRGATHRAILNCRLPGRGVHILGFSQHKH